MLVLNALSLLRISIVIILMLSVFNPITAHASVTKEITESISMTNNFPIAIPAGTTIGLSISNSASGNMNVTSPGGIVKNIAMTGLGTDPYKTDIALNETGVYNVSESYELRITTSVNIPGYEPIVNTYNSSNAWTFNNPGIGIGKLEVTSSVTNVSVGGTVGPISISLSGNTLPISATVLTTAPINIGDTVGASVSLLWVVSSSIIPIPSIGNMEVITNMSSATFSLTGPASYSGGGTYWIYNGTPAGDYTITYGNIAGYLTPPSETKTLVSNGKISFNGVYKGIGTIKVTTNLASAAFSISGPASYSGGGTSWTKTEAPIGVYAIEYADVAGYTKPSSSFQILSPGGTITFTGEYKEILPGTIVVNTNLALSAFSLSGAASYSGGGVSWTKTGAPVGTYNIEYNDVAGYEKPSSETKTLISGGTITFNGVYTSIGPLTGTIVVNTNLAQSSFSLSGAANYSGSGKFWVQIDAPEGKYTITYNEITGYEKPIPETKTLTPGGKITFNGIYRSIIPGAIEVNTNLDQASFNISGPASFSGSGRSWSQASAPEGDYTITYGDVVGYSTPPSAANTLAPGGKITFNGIYKEVMPGVIVVNTNLDQASFIISGAVSYNGNGKSWTQPQAPAGRYTIKYLDVPGFTAPASETKTLSSNSTITFSGKYIDILIPPEIQKVIVTGSPAKSGGTIRLTLIASPRCFAAFSIDKVASGTLSELPSTPGTYTASFAAPKGVEVIDRPVNISVKDTNGLSVNDSSQKVTVDTLATISSVKLSNKYPGVGETVIITVEGDLRSLVSFSIKGIQGQMGENPALPGNYTAKFTVLSSTAQGDSPVEIKLFDPSGNIASNSDQVITIGYTPRIDSVSIYGNPANPGTAIVVFMAGKSDGKATFSIENVVSDLSMTESKSTPGSYTGKYTVPKGIRAKDAVLSVKLEGGGLTAINAENRVTISSYPWDVNDDDVVDILDIKAVGLNLGNTSNPKLDVNGDGTVNVLDMIIVGKHYGEQYGQAGK